VKSMTYRVKIVKEGQEFEAEGDKKFVLDMLSRFETVAPAATPSASSSTKATKSASAAAVQAAAAGKQTSVGEFIRLLGLKKHTDLVLAFGYYLEKYAGLQAFTPADINTCYYEAKMESSNTSQMIILNIRRGFLMPAKRDKEKGKKAYTLTRSGEDFINNSAKKPSK